MFYKLPALVKTGLVLMSFAVVGTSLVSFSYQQTAEQIRLNEREALLNSIHALLPPSLCDNQILSDTVQMTNFSLLGNQEPVTFYRGRKQGKPIAVLFMPTAPDGYSGQIKFLIGIDYAGKILGIRVLSHRETPGLGDAIEHQRSDWDAQFIGKTYHDPESAHWSVKRDGGVFDQLTGATITPRAVVKAIRQSLVFFNSYREQLFAQTIKPEQP